jgi:hypothetical protein
MADPPAREEPMLDVRRRNSSRCIPSTLLSLADEVIE